MASGQVGISRVAAKRIAFPDFQRSQAIDGEGSGRSEIPVISTLADAKESQGKARPDIPSISIITDVRESRAEGQADRTRTRLVHDASAGEAEGRGDIPETLLVTDATSGQAIGTPDIPVIETVHDATDGEAKGSAEITVNNEVADSVDSRGEARAGQTVNFNLSISQGVTGEAVGRAETTIVTWAAGLGGTVVLEEGGPGVEGAEIVIIRDNDNTQVAKTTTDSNGRWHVTLPGGKTTDSDPEVYTMEVWYRDGPKREKTTEIYNAKNRPYIDTADPSERNPYQDDNVEN